MAFDLLGDDPSGSDDGAGRFFRSSLSFGSDGGQGGGGGRGEGAEAKAPPPMRQRLLRAIHQELSVLAVEADGVSEKVKVCIVCLWA